MRKGHCTILGMDDPRRKKVQNRAEQQQTRQVEMQKNPNNKAIKFPGSKQSCQNRCKTRLQDHIVKPKSNQMSNK